MSNIIRIILGLAVLIGAWRIKQIGPPAEEGGTVAWMGREVSPSTLDLLALAFGLIGIAMVAIGLLGLKKAR